MPHSAIPQLTFDLAAQQIVQICHQFYRQSWLPATSGNISARIDQTSCAITMSGRHKGQVSSDDIMRVGLDGRLLSEGKPSAETGLHLQLYRAYSDVGMVLHTHSQTATVLSLLDKNNHKITLSGYELLKALRGVDTHNTSISIPVLENSQDIDALAGEVERHIARNELDCDAYIIRGHGLYVWGRDAQEALRQIEALEFLLNCELELKKWQIK